MSAAWRPRAPLHSRPWCRISSLPKTRLVVTPHSRPLGPTTSARFHSRRVLARVAERSALAGRLQPISSKGVLVTGSPSALRSASVNFTWIAVAVFLGEKTAFQPDTWNWGIPPSVVVGTLLITSADPGWQRQWPEDSAKMPNAGQPRGHADRPRLMHQIIRSKCPKTH
jgi:hypothetical protein